MILKLITESPGQTRLLGEILVKVAGKGCVLALEGDLGAGKTTFTQGVARALAIEEPITSPTFTLINEYDGKCPLYHVDLYRLEGPVDLWDLGLEEYLGVEGVVVVEWAEKAGGFWNFPRGWRLTFRVQEGDRREVCINSPSDEDGERLKEALASEGIEVEEWRGS